MQKVIGLDIGSYSIKAVEIVNTFKSYEIANFYENVIPRVDELSPDVVIPSCMEQLFLENKLQADRIITAMPGQYVSSRILPFHFSDPRKIETAVMAQIEDYVPFNLDEMVVDHQILGTMKGRTIALVVMTRKNFLRSFLDHLQRIDIDPKLIDVDSLAFYNLYPFLNLDQQECTALVDIGHEKTSVCIVRDGVLRMFRSINLGGRYITEFLARDLEVDFAEAQRTKHEVSRVLCEKAPSELQGHELMVAERMTLAANAIVKELGRTLYSFKSWEKDPVRNILLSGGTSRIQNIEYYLQEQLEIPVKRNNLRDTDLKISPHLEDVMPELPQSAAIGIRAISSIKRHSQINLRTGEFAYTQNYESVMRGAGVAFRFVSIALLLLIISYAFQYYFYNRQIETIQSQYKAEFLQLFPEFKKRHSRGNLAFATVRKDAKTQLTGDIDRLRIAMDEFVAQNSGSGALLALKAISEAIPKEVKVDVTLFQYTSRENGGGKIILKGETDGYTGVAGVLEAVKSIPEMSEVEEKGSAAKPGTDNRVIEFTFHATFTPGTSADDEVQS